MHRLLLTTGALHSYTPVQSSLANMNNDKDEIVNDVSHCTACKTPRCTLPYDRFTWGTHALSRCCTTTTMVDRTLCTMQDGERYGMGLLLFNGTCNGAVTSIFCDPGANGTPTHSRTGRVGLDRIILRP